MVDGRAPERTGRTARVLLFAADGRLVLIRRTRPGVAAYLTTPGGGLEPGETDREAATRECAEELGATVALGDPVWSDGEGQVVLLGRLLTLDPDAATGEELRDPSRGAYEPVLLALDDPLLDGLKPEALAAIVRRDGEVLRDRAASLG